MKKLTKKQEKQFKAYNAKCKKERAKAVKQRKILNRAINSANDYFDSIEKEVPEFRVGERVITNESCAISGKQGTVVKIKPNNIYLVELDGDGKAYNFEADALYSLKHYVQFRIKEDLGNNIPVKNIAKFNIGDKVIAHLGGATKDVVDRIKSIVLTKNYKGDFVYEYILNTYTCQGHFPEDSLELYTKPVQLLDKAERRFLRNLLIPVHADRIYKQKTLSGDEFLVYEIRGDEYTLPVFRKGTMYAGLELNKVYSLGALGIK